MRAAAPFRELIERKVLPMNDLADLMPMNDLADRDSLPVCEYDCRRILEESSRDMWKWTAVVSIHAWSVLRGSST